MAPTPNQLIAQSELVAHMVRLAVCAGLWFLLGLYVLKSRKPREQQKAFWQMAVAWSAVNLLICALGWPKTAPVIAPLREFLMFNMGLNLAYISVGIALFAPQSATKKLKGAGQSVVWQGVQLLVLDGVLLWRLGPSS